MKTVHTLSSSFFSDSLSSESSSTAQHTHTHTHTSSGTHSQGLTYLTDTPPHTDTLALIALFSVFSFTIPFLCSSVAASVSVSASASVSFVFLSSCRSYSPHFYILHLFALHTLRRDFLRLWACLCRFASALAVSVSVHRKIYNAIEYANIAYLSCRQIHPHRHRHRHTHAHHPPLLSCICMWVGIVSAAAL